jgi:hypothetical protein
MDKPFIVKTFRIKNLSCSSTVLLLRDCLLQAEFHVHDIKPGFLVVSKEQTCDLVPELKQILSKYGLSIIKNKEKQLVEEIKLAIFELIYQLNNVNSIIQRSDYLVEKLGRSYQTLSKVFSSHENTTLEKYIIEQKIKRVGELIEEDEYTLSEIAYMMEYSSVQYLSNQFKKITGVSVSDYKKSLF